MCRSIVQLRLVEGTASDEQIQAAALQYVRKVSGYRKPSRRNQAAFEQAVEAVARATLELLKALDGPRPDVVNDGGLIPSPKGRGCPDCVRVG